MAIKLLTQIRSTDEELAEHYYEASFQEDLEASYQFKVALPKTWTRKTLTVNYPNQDGSIELLARVLSEGNHSSLSVWCTLLPREVNPSDWLLLWVKTQDYQLIDARKLPTQYGTVGDCIASKVIDGEAYISRLFAIKDGNRLFLLNQSTPQDSYKDHEEAFLVGVQTFSLLTPTKELYAEPFTQEQIKKPYPITYRKPESWSKFVEHEESNDELSISFTNQLSDQIMGKINLIMIAAVHELSTQELLSAWFKKLRLNGYKIISDMDNLQTHQYDGKEVISWAGHANADESLVSLNTTIIYHKRGTLMINLISPPPSSNHEAWAINYRYYEILLKTAKLD